MKTFSLNEPLFQVKAPLSKNCICFQVHVAIVEQKGQAAYIKLGSCSNFDNVRQGKRYSTNSTPI